MPPFLNIIVFRQRRNLPGTSGQLPCALQDDLCPPVILLDRPVNLDHLSLQLTYVAYVLEVAGEHHDSEGTHLVVLAEIEKGDAAIAFPDSEHLAADTSSFTYVFLSLRNRDAIRDGDSREKKCHN